MTGPAGAMEIQDGTVDGDRATWTGEITSPMAISFKVTVTVTGDTLDGEADQQPAEAAAPRLFGYRLAELAGDRAGAHRAA